MPYASIKRPNSRQLPQGGRHFSIDWTNPLTKGLECCYLLGLAGGVNIAGKGFDLTLPGASTAPGMTADGPATNTPSGNQGPFSAAIPTTHPLTAGTQGSVFWRGAIDTFVSFGGHCGICYNNPETSPFAVWGLIGGSAASNAFRAEWNSGGAQNSTANGAAVTLGSVSSLLATFKVGGNAQVYTNGVAGTATAGIAQWANTATSYIVVAGEGSGAVNPSRTNIVCFWSRELSAAEAMSLHVDPYQFVIIDETYSVIAAPIVASAFVYHQFPPGGRCYRIDWKNPLTKGLEVCYIPGFAGGVNITRKGFDLTLARATPGMTPEGPALVTAQGTNVNSSFSAAIPTTHPLVTSNQASLYWRGLLTTAVNPSALFGVAYGSGDADPFHVYTVCCSNTANKMRIGTNQGTGAGSAVNGNDSASSIPNGTFGSFAATFSYPSNPGTTQFYYNGLPDGSATSLPYAQKWGSSASSMITLSGESTGTGSTAIGSSCSIACIWTRALSAAEIAALDANPYQFIIVDAVPVFYQPAFWWLAENNMEAAMRSPNKNYLRR